MVIGTVTGMVTPSPGELVVATVAAKVRNLVRGQTEYLQGRIELRGHGAHTDMNLFFHFSLKMVQFELLLRVVPLMSHMACPHCHR